VYICLTRSSSLRLLLSSFTPDQLARYETYRRSTLNKQSVRRVSCIRFQWTKSLLTPIHVQFIHQSLGANVSVNVAQVIAGFSKVFVGEIIELGTSPETNRPFVAENAHTPYLLLSSNLYFIPFNSSACSANIITTGCRSGAPLAGPPPCGISVVYTTDGSCRFGKACKRASTVCEIAHQRNSYDHSVMSWLVLVPEKCHPRCRPPVSFGRRLTSRYE
jgi:hypothetical protein